jgi:Cu/Ag efflux protein CusF
MRDIDTGIIDLRFELQGIHDQETASPFMRPSCAMPGPLLLVAALALPGCWSAPIATLQSKSKPHRNQGAIAVAVESVKPPAVVQSVDLAARAITVLRPGAGLISYKVGLNVSNLERLKAGDKVRATVAEELTVYLSRDGDLPSAGSSPHTVVTDAQVLSVDPSYRLLTLHFPDGHTEMFKASLGMKLDKMETGDEVTIRPVEALALRLKK